MRKILATAAILFAVNASAAPRLAFQVYAVRDLAAKDFVGTLKAAKAIGYEGVETGRLYGYSAKSLKRTCEETGLELVALQLYPYNLTEPQLWETIRYCKECGCRRICTAWFKGSEENPNDWQLVVNVINRAAKICEKEGISVAYHNHDQEFRFMLQGRTAWEWLFEPHPQTLDNVQTSSMLPFSLSVGQELDPAWCVLAGGDPVVWLKRYSGRHMTMHVSTNVTADWPLIVKTAESVGVEWLVAKPTDSPASMDGLKRSYDVLREILGKEERRTETERKVSRNATYD